VLAQQVVHNDAPAPQATVVQEIPVGSSPGKARAAAALVMSGPAAEAPLAGTITGRVVASGTQLPLEAVQVQVVGTQIGGLTTANGRYLLPGVPAGTHEVRVSRLGYRTVTTEVVVRDGQPTEANFQLSEEVLVLDEIVVTGTAGGTRRRAIGNAVESLSADKLTAIAPVKNMDQLLAQRSPGVMMLPGTGQVGTGSAIRIRGNSSISLANEPIIYIDGVRMDSDSRRGPSQRGGANVSRLNDINPADIESIEIIKGPAAATLYGTEASNGVVQIITKRGASGAPQFSVSSRIGTNWLWNPEGRTEMRYMPDPDNPGQLFGFNVYEHERLHGNGPIFGYGLLQNYNVNVRGGTDAVRYFASVSRDDDRGIVSWNWDKRLAVRGNLEMNLSEKWNVRFGSAYIQSQTRLAQGSIDTDPFSNLIWSNPRGLNTPTRGWRAAPPEEWGKVESRLDNDRTTTNIELRFQPMNWMTHRLVAGLDLNAEASWTLYPQMPEGKDHFYGNLGLGSKSVSRGNRRYLTLDYAGSANIDWNEYTFTPSVGFQYYRSQSSFINSSGSEFPAIPITTVSGGAVRNGGESFSENATAGVYFQQQVGWRDRVFVTGAIRADANSAFGSEFNAAYYPKVSATWSMHEEPFWTLDWMDQFRIRTAWGAAGQQPGTIDATRLYGAVIGYKDAPALIPSAYGNPHLKPERGEELELGFDASFLGGRLTLEATRYQRAVKDAIIGRPLPPSSGFTGSQIVNIGQLSAWGNELAMTARLLERPSFRWELDTQYSTMANKIDDLGGLGFIGGGTQSQHREGYSIGDLFMKRILSAEIDDKGKVLSAICDGGRGPQGVDPGGASVDCGDAPQVWLGHSQPTWQIGVGNTFTLFNNLSFYLRVEGNGGHKQVNTEIRATHNQSTTEAVLLGNNPILQATRSIENDRTGVYEAGFLRLREISANYTLPNRFAGAMGARSGSVSLGMRNVMMLWTAQHGWSTPRDGAVRESIANMITWDPEVRSTGQAAVDYQTVLPPAASATMTIRLSF
jgi:TonB-linked SusC/RagA family outer membrane protein